ncbi:MAG TPA: chloride channel protein [Anaeromyxobacter sp.]
MAAPVEESHGPGGAADPREEEAKPRDAGRPAERPIYYRSLREFLRQLPGPSQRFWVLVVATGVVSGVGAVGLLELLTLVKKLAWGDAATMLAAFASSSPARRVAVPAIGGALVTATMLLVRGRLGGHGTSGIIESIWVQQGRMPLGRSLLRGVVSIVAVGMGASLGREGALLQTGAASGSWLARTFNLTPDHARLLVACGAASGISAAYNVPIGGALFGLEVLLGSFALELLGPIVLSCVTATVIARLALGASPSYVVPGYALLKPTELLVGLAMAPILGVASALYIKVLGWTEALLYRLPRWIAVLLPPAAMALVGAAAIRSPDLLGNGYDTVESALVGRAPFAILLALPLLKLAATALCAGSGVPGGLFTPSLMYGALLGGAFGELAHRIYPGLGAPASAFALVGMAGVLAGTTRASVSAVLIIFELTGDYGVIVPLMLSAFVAAATSRALEPDSLYTAPLRRRGVKLPELPRPEWLDLTPIREILRSELATVAPDTPFPDVLRRLLTLPAASDLYVVDGRGSFLGVITLDGLKGHLGDEHQLEMIVAADVMDRSVQPLTSAMRLSEAAPRFAEAVSEHLPVVDDERRLVGTASKRDILKHGRF